MRLGKLDNDTLDRLILQKFIKTRPESFGPPRIGMDCATLDFGSDLIVTSCDPITSADAAHVGALSVHVNCNDAAAGGAEPVGLLVTLLLPPDATEQTVGMIADELAAAAKQAGVDILGGHTEVTDAVTRVVTCTTVLAKAPKTGILPGARVGDAIVMTKWAGLEGTLLLATDHAERLKAVDPALLERARALGRHLSVVPESRIALKHGAHAMHDVTEGGVLGAVFELAAQTGVGAVIEREAIPVLPETEAFCAALGLDPLRLIASGAMLIACPDPDALLEALHDAGTPAARIGTVSDGGARFSDGTPIDPPGADELYRLF